MRSVIAIVGIAAFFGATDVRAKDACRGSDVKYYDEALAFHLAKRGVPYRVADKVVCVTERNAPELLAAQTQVDAAFHQVAYLLQDSCEERAFTDWAEREKLRFDVRPTLDAQGRPSKSMFLLRSFTREEVASNSSKLATGAPREATCTDPGQIGSGPPKYNEAPK